MPIDFRNTNSIWASVLVETLQRLGLAAAILCPGSRSTPLTVAFAQHEKIEAIPILDERSAAFFALGLARQTHQPVVLVCTSGTAGANFYPALIEARESRVPLLLLTADRPPELRDCNAGQAIDQLKLFGTFPNWQTELALPELSVELLTYLRQTVVHAWTRSRCPVPGPVHLNLPFRDPLAPTPQPQATAFQTQFQTQFPAGKFWRSVAPPTQFPPAAPSSSALPLQDWQSCSRGIIVAGPAQPESPEDYCLAIAHLSQFLAWPVLAEALSPLRNYTQHNPNLVTTYDPMLRHPHLASQLVPEQVIRIGPLPTSKVLRRWLQTVSAQHWVVDACDRNLDPLHSNAQHLRLSIEQLARSIPPEPQPPKPYLKQWLIANTQLRQKIDRDMQATNTLIEPKVAWSLSQILPHGTPFFIANSTPIRDAEWFWSPSNRNTCPYFNRGANGIDGTLSTALGIAHRNQPSVLLTGDLALLHDTNGFLLHHHWIGHLTIVLINNNGGGIFEMLPIAQFDPLFEDFFATPQKIDFAHFCATYRVAHQRIYTWQQLNAQLNPLPETGIRVLELQTHRRHDNHWRQRYLGQLTAKAVE